MASPAIPAEPTDSAAPARRGPAAPLTARLVTLVEAAVAAVVGAWIGAWWVPFVIGVAAGLPRAKWSPLSRGGVLPAVAGAIIGWLIPVWVLALRGQPAGATARAVAGLAGLPPYAGVTIAVLALLAALQVWVGAWLARAVFPRAGRSLATDDLGEQQHRKNSATPRDPQT
ncbi:MAG TPA: hypothetical protein VN714_28560 [Trebonia sp.]|nr:hypothetical protein [Trebonia sp.]